MGVGGVAWGCGLGAASGGVGGPVGLGWCGRSSSRRSWRNVTGRMVRWLRGEGCRKRRTLVLCSLFGLTAH